MTTYNTGNPIGSTDARDLYDNAQNLDNFANGTNASYSDRLGATRRSLAGIEATADNVLNSIGYAVPIAYAGGISLTLTSQTVDYNGVIYAPLSSALPFTTSSWGTDSSKFRAIQVTDANLITYNPAGAVATTVQSKLRETVSVKDFGAVGDGVTDDTAAIQAATNTGKTVYFPDGSYKMLGSVTYSGRVVWVGNGQNSRILNDGTVLTVTSGTGSLVDNLYAENITAPWIISRNPSNWASVPAVVQSNSDGYQPTINDSDVWSSLTAAQQSQDIGPKLVFQGNASDIQVSRIYGRFVSVIMKDTIRSVVRDCDFRAGKNFGGGIVFWNIDGQAGSHNEAINNHIRYPSFCGVMFARNFDGMMRGNHVEYAGESGIKTYQNTVGGVDARCYRMFIHDNNTKFCYYDGFDLSSDYPHTGTVDSRHQIIGNNTFNSRQTGFYADGLNNQFIGNMARGTNKTGIRLHFGYSQINNNHVYDCNTGNAVSGEHQISVDGSNNEIVSNFVRQIVANGYAIYATGTNYVANNYAHAGNIFLGNAGSITAIAFNNRGASTTRVDSTMPQGVRQDSGSTPGIEVFNENTSADYLNISFSPRRHTGISSTATINGSYNGGTSGSEHGWLYGQVKNSGTLQTGFIAQGGRGTNVPVFYSSAPNSAINSAWLSNGSVGMYLDEAGNSLKFAVKYSSGTVKTGTVALV